MKVFVDSNIFLDYYFDRKNHIKPLGEFAFQFIKRALACEFELVICDRVLDEIKRKLELNSLEVERRIFHELNSAKKLEIIDYSDQQALEAKQLGKNTGFPINDCLYAVIARDLTIPIVSRDNHFKEILFVEVFSPEEL